MRRSTLAVAAAGLSVIVLTNGVPVAHAATPGDVKCQTKKLAALAKLYTGNQKCLAKALVDPTKFPPDPCLQTVGGKLDAAFAKADTLGTCSGTAGVLRPRVEAQSLDVASLIGFPASCDDLELLSRCACGDGVGLCVNHVIDSTIVGKVCAPNLFPDTGGNCSGDVQCASPEQCLTPFPSLPPLDPSIIMSRCLVPCGAATTTTTTSTTTTTTLVCAVEAAACGSCPNGSCRPHCGVSGEPLACRGTGGTGTLCLSDAVCAAGEICTSDTDTCTDCTIVPGDCTCQPTCP